jgi:hypothetical protein
MEYMGLALIWNNGKSKDVFFYCMEGAFTNECRHGGRYEMNEDH